MKITKTTVQRANEQRSSDGKRTIRQNAWGNWHGYISGKRSETFANMPYASAEDLANDWVKKTPERLTT
jgi:hypothetical protein